MSRRLALIVGVEKYSDQQIRSLECVDHDCTELYGFLRHAAGFEVELLRSPASADVLDQARRLAQGLTAGDLFLFYFAGHGVEFQGRHLLLCPRVVMGRLRYYQEVIPVDLLKEETAGPADRVLVLDACRNDPEKSRSTPAGLKGERSLRDIVCAGGDAEEGSLAILCACSEGHVAAEVPGSGHGLFTKSLLDEMQEGLRDGRQVELGTPLQQSLAERMTKLATHAGLAGTQSPWVQLSGRRVPVLIEGRAANAPPVSRPKPSVQVIEPARLHITSNPLGAAVEIDGGTVGTTPAAVELKPGTYAVKVSKAGYDQWERRIRFEGQGDAELTATLVAKPKERRAGEVLALSSVKMAMAWIPPGEFMMGSPAGEPERVSDETQHRVRLTKGFWMGTTPVTQAQWEAVMGSNPSNFKGADLPVEAVSWDDCQKFCTKLSQREGKKVRLPTEAEWEYACRAGSTTPFSFGTTISTDQANYDGNYTYGSGRKGLYRQKTTPVGQFHPNAWGLYDMHGNVWEWCADWYGEYPKTKATDYMGPASGTSRVLRGGSWLHDPLICRAAYRFRRSPYYRTLIVGFRLALDF
jgi:formylglycine-generating enzyme required for sulfatase activity